MLDAIPNKKTLKIGKRIIPSATKGMDTLLDDYTKGWNAAINKIHEQLSASKDKGVSDGKG